MGKKVAGTCYIKVDGEQLELSGNMEFQPNKVSRESVLSTGGVVGYKETVVAPYISGDFVVTEEFPWTTITENTDMTITVECANGMVYTLSGAYLIENAAFKPIDGTVSLKFEGTNGELA